MGVSEQDKTSEALMGETEAREGEACPRLLSQLLAEFSLSSRDHLLRSPAFFCSASLCTSVSPPSSPLPFPTTSTTFCFLVQTVMILLLHCSFLPNRSPRTVQVLVKDITRHPSFLITLCS